MLKIATLTTRGFGSSRSRHNLCEKVVRFTSIMAFLLRVGDTVKATKRSLFSLCGKPRALPALAFLIPTFVRAIPEILMGPFVVGFDVLAYNIPNTLLWLRGSVSAANFVGSAPLFYLLLMGITYAGVPIVFSVKVLSPLLLGFLGLAVFYYAKKSLLWSSRKSLLVVLFATLYFVALRVSWDMLRSELSLIFLFVTFFFLEKRGGSTKNWLLLSFSMIAVVATHQLVAVIMLFVVLLTTFGLAFGRDAKEATKLICCSMPAIFFFLLVSANYSLSLGVAAPFISFPGLTSNGWLSLFGFASKANLTIDSLGFLVVCYLPLLPLLYLGFKRRISPHLEAWILWILIAVSVAVITAYVFFGILPYRWILLLTFPFAFVAAEGFAQLTKRKDKIVISSAMVFLSLSFVVLPSGFTLPYFSLFSHYGPASMLQNTVPLSDCHDTLNALDWAGNNFGNESRLLVHDAFYGWAILTINDEQLIPYGYNDPEAVATELTQNGSGYQLYLIWWINGTGWHGQINVPKSFAQVYRSGNIAIYSLNSDNDVFSLQKTSDFPCSVESSKRRLW